MSRGGTSSSDPEEIFFLELYQKYKDLLYHMACKYTKNPTDQEDLVQETLLRLMQYRDRLRGMNEPKQAAYIALTMKSRFLTQRLHDHDALYVDMPDEDIHAILDRRAAYSYVQPDQLTGADAKLLLEQLSPEDRLLLNGWYIAGWTAEELASLLGCKPSSIRAKLSRARKRAYKKLVDTEPEQPAPQLIVLERGKAKNG